MTMEGDQAACEGEGCPGMDTRPCRHDAGPVDIAEQGPDANRQPPRRCKRQILTQEGRHHGNCEDRVAGSAPAPRRSRAASAWMGAVAPCSVAQALQPGRRRAWPCSPRHLPPAKDVDGRQPVGARLLRRHPGVAKHQFHRERRHARLRGRRKAHSGQIRL